MPALAAAAAACLRCLWLQGSGWCRPKPHAAASATSWPVPCANDRQEGAVIVCNVGTWQVLWSRSEGLEQDLACLTQLATSCKLRGHMVAGWRAQCHIVCPVCLRHHGACVYSGARLAAVMCMILKYVLMYGAARQLGACDVWRSQAARSLCAWPREAAGPAPGTMCLKSNHMG
jgi:hypothetical protein